MLNELKPYLIYLTILLLLVIGGLIGLGFLLYYKYNFTLFWSIMTPALSIMTPALVILVTVGVNLIVQLVWWVIKKVGHLE